MKCVVKIRHLKPAYRKGDLEEEIVIEEATPFKTKGEASKYIDGKIKILKNQNCKVRGNKKEGYSVYTGKKWQNENTGETNEEAYFFEIV